ncbi:DUF4131 domain-containing protein [Chloroflexota bacterium]
MRLGGGYLSGVEVRPVFSPCAYRAYPSPSAFFLRKQKKTLILASLCLIALFGGAFCFQSSQPVVDEKNLQSYNEGETVEIRGMVDSDPEVRDKTTHLRFSATEIKKVAEDWQEVSERLCSLSPDILFGRQSDSGSA